jgi:hypothetical protein
MRGLAEEELEVPSAQKSGYCRARQKRFLFIIIITPIETLNYMHSLFCLVR